MSHRRRGERASERAPARAPRSAAVALRRAGTVSPRPRAAGPPAVAEPARQGAARQGLARPWVGLLRPRAARPGRRAAGPAWLPAAPADAPDPRSSAPAAVWIRRAALPGRARGSGAARLPRSGRLRGWRLRKATPKGSPASTARAARPRAPPGYWCATPRTGGESPPPLRSATPRPPARRPGYAARHRSAARSCSFRRRAGSPGRWPP